MLKQLILLVSLLQLAQCLSTRSNSKSAELARHRELSHAMRTSVSRLVWWSRRNEQTQTDCDVEFTNENPSLEAKICGR